jgi:hypothetical protein
MSDEKEGLRIVEILQGAFGVMVRVVVRYLLPSIMRVLSRVDMNKMLADDAALMRRASLMVKAMTKMPATLLVFVLGASTGELPAVVKSASPILEKAAEVDATVVKNLIDRQGTALGGLYPPLLEKMRELKEKDRAAIAEKTARALPETISQLQSAWPGVTELLNRYIEIDEELREIPHHIADLSMNICIDGAAVNFRLAGLKLLVSGGLGEEVDFTVTMTKDLIADIVKAFLGPSPMEVILTMPMDGLEMEGYAAVAFTLLPLIRGVMDKFDVDMERLLDITYLDTEFE